MKPHDNTGIRRLVRATRWSWSGLKQATTTETAFLQELVLSLILVPLGLWIGDGPVEKVLLAGSLLLVLIVELLNSAVERIADRISTEAEPLLGQAKDMGSAAVFLSLVNVALIWGGIVFF